MGPTLGGLLARPTVNFPSIFPPDSFFGRYPFLLPNLICTGILILGLCVGILFLEETHHTHKFSRDTGVELGKCVLRLFKRRRTSKYAPLSNGSMKEVSSSECILLEAGIAEEEEELPEYSPMDNVELPGYRTTDGTPRQSSSRSVSPRPFNAKGSMSGNQPCNQPCNLEGVTFTRNVVLNIAAFGILA